MGQRVVALVTVGPPQEARVEALSQALVATGTHVETLAVPLPRVGLPRFRLPKQLFELGGGLAALIRRRPQAIVLVGGAPAMSVLGLLPRALGTRVVLDLVEEPQPNPLGKALAPLSKPLAKLVDAVLARDESHAAQLRRSGLEAFVAAPLGPDLSGYPRREKQPRVTVKTPVRLAVSLRGFTGPARAVAVDRLEAALSSGTTEACVEGLTPGERIRLEAEGTVEVIGCPDRPSSAWLEAVSECHVALTLADDVDEVLPFVSVGLPVIAPTGGALVRAFGEEDLSWVNLDDGEALATRVARLARSSRERRDYIRKGWEWLEARGWSEAQAGLDAALS